MSTIVVMPGGFHPFHAGHMSLYNSALKAFPDAEVYVAATNDTKTRPFPFQIKEKLAKVAGVAPGHFVQVKSPFQPREITSQYDPEKDVLIFVRSEKDKNESPTPGGTKKDGSPSYLQPYTKGQLQPFAKHAYMAYLPTVEFGPGITSATEIRNAWPKLDDRRKTAMVMSLYPATQKNPKLAANVVKMLDMAMGGELEEDISRRGLLKGLAGAGALGAAGKASAIAGAFPTPSAQQAMYKAAADSNRAEAKRQAELQAKADKERLAKNTPDVERLNKVNYHGKDAPKPTNAEWDGDSDFLYLDGTQYAKASRMPISGDVPSDLTLVSTREGRQVYLWTRRSLKGVQGHYFYPAEKPNTINEFAPGNGDDDDYHQFEYEVYQCNPNDEFDWIGGPLYKTDSMGMAHKYAYEMFLKHRPKAFMIWQENTQGSRGHYGVKDERGVIEDLNEFASGGDFKPPMPPKNNGNDPWGNDDRSKIVQAVRQLLKAGNKVDWKVPGQMGHVVRADDHGVVMKRWNKPYSKIHYSLHLSDDQDDQYQILMVKPGHYKVVSTDTSWNLEEGFGLPMPTTYEQERGIRTPSKAQRITAMTNEDHDMDPEMKAIYQKAIQHYPNAKDKQEAFVKYVQRALMHSEVDDNEQNQRLEILDKEVDQLQKQMKQVKVSESTDYLDEK